MLLVLAIAGLVISCASPQSDNVQDSSNVDLDNENNIDDDIDNVKDDIDIDIDLTIFGSTMLTAKLNDIMQNASLHVGKSIRVSGSYVSEYYEPTEKDYHYIIIDGADACCAQGIEFIWNGEHTYPNDYPQFQERIEIVGVYSCYEELGFEYYYLAVDDLTTLK